MTDKINGNWPWWKIGDGFFVHTDYGKHLPNEKAFPSGHLAATFIMCMIMYLFTGVNSKSRKFNVIKWIGLSIALIYVLDVVFALQVSLSHWWSDIVFTMAWAPVAFWISYWIVTPSLNAISKKYKLKHKK